MTMAIKHDFEEDLNDNQTEETDKRVLKNCMERFSIPNAIKRGWDPEHLAFSLYRGTPSQDRKGIDYILYLPNLNRAYIDVKNRPKFRNYDACHFFDEYDPPVALEIWSAFYGKDDPRNKPGWAWNPKKTDYFLILYDPADTRVSLLLPAKLLSLVVQENAKDWMKLVDRNGRSCYEPQNNGNYVSWCVFIPASLLGECIFEYEFLHDTKALHEELNELNYGISVLDSVPAILPFEGNPTLEDETVERAYNYYEIKRNPQNLYAEEFREMNKGRIQAFLER